MALKIGSKDVVKLAIGDSVFEKPLIGTSGYFKPTGDTTTYGDANGNSHNANFIDGYTLSANDTNLSFDEDHIIMFDADDSPYTIMGIIGNMSDGDDMIYIDYENHLNGSYAGDGHIWVKRSKLLGGGKILTYLLYSYSFRLGGGLI